MNIFKIVLVVILHQILGFLWYSPMLFSQQWLGEQGKTAQDINPKDPGPFLVAVVSTVIMTIVLSVLINQMKATTSLEGAKVAFYIWLGFIFPAILTHYAFLDHPFGLVSIDAGYNLVGILLAGAILGGWRSKVDDLKTLRI